MSTKKQFTNELGNSIQVEVSEKDIDGVPGVLIIMEGPTSTAENHITRKEAEVLHEELGILLKNSSEEPHNLPDTM